LVGELLLLGELPAPEVSQLWLNRFATEFPTAGHVAPAFDKSAGRLALLGWFVWHGFGAQAPAVMTATKVGERWNSNRDAVYRPLGSDEDWAQSVEP
jgi:hypothetical protein